MRHIYLHGFASGPQSRKAQSFRSAFGALGLDLEIPDLAGGDFEHLTISGQLAVIYELLRGDPANLIGSSIGGYLASLYASTHPEVSRLALLAPAFGFSSRWPDMLGVEKVDEWRDTGWMAVYHYGDKRERRLHYGLFEDALRYQAFPDFTQPAAIFHGVSDETVPVSLSREFVAGHPNASLTEVDSDHELLSALDLITRQSMEFLLG